MNLERFKNFKLSKAAAVILAVAVTVAGTGVMVLANGNGAEARKTAENTEEKLNLVVPGAGMGDVLERYVGATSGSTIELLSTTALASSLGEEFNEFYDASGNTIGKLIVYNGESAADVYDKIVGNERIEAGEIPAAVIGHMYAGDVATLVREQGDWYQIISDSVNGYVRKEGFARGVEAEKLAGATYVNSVYANSSDVMLFAEDYEDSTVLCVLPAGVRYTLLEPGDTLSKIYVTGVGEGWILNSSASFGTERRYATELTRELDAQTKIAEGVTLAAEIEEVKAQAAAAQQQEVGTQQVLQAINIAPAAADTGDVAALRQAIADYAQQFVGVLPYISASSDLSYGADCSGFTSAIYRAFGYDISRTPEGQFWEGQQVSLDDIRPGDIVYYSGHVALYVGNGMVVHESVPGTTASYADMWMMPVNGVVRYVN